MTKYAQAVTLIDELPQMIQLPPTQKTVNMDPRFATGVGSQNKNDMFNENIYYEEIVKDYPNIQSKIRKTDPNPFGKYNETMETKVVYHQENDDSIYSEIQNGQQHSKRYPNREYSSRQGYSSQHQEYPNQYDYSSQDYYRDNSEQKQFRYPSNVPYKLKEPTKIVYNNKFSSPGTIEMDYMNANMFPVQEEQHLPVSAKQRSHYNKPMISNNFDTYPIVENYSISCTDVMDHINKCPVCYKLYRRNEMFYLAIMGFLILLIFV